MTITNLKFANGLEINWQPGDDGGGSTQYVDFLESVKKTNRKYEYGLEWCAGLSAIAFALIDAKLVNNFVLMDKYEPALLTAMSNAQDNNLQDRVQMVCADSIYKIPSSHKFDLVVGNPPHCGIDPIDYSVDNPLNERTKRLLLDIDWQIHKEFFENIHKYLLPNADVFISENGPYQYLVDFAEQGKLKLVNTYSAKVLKLDTREDGVVFYFKYET